MNVICDYCGKPAQFVDSASVYHGHSYGMVYYCPDCQAWVGVHKGTDRPLGRLADAELRRWKRIAHMNFDRIWRNNRRMSRKKAYEWLSSQMGLPAEETHIGMFDVGRCKEVIALCKKRLGETSNA